MSAYDIYSSVYFTGKDSIISSDFNSREKSNRDHQDMIAKEKAARLEKERYQSERLEKEKRDVKEKYQTEKMEKDLKRKK